MNESPIEIRITSDAYLKLRYYIEECPTEVSGFGKVRRVRIEPTETKTYWSKSPVDAEEYLQIYDIEILKQEASGTHSTIDEEILAGFLSEKLGKGESVEDYKVWWHSHATMEAFFSGTDTGTIDGSTEFRYLISIVGNKKGAMKVRLDIYDPFRITFEDIEVKVEPPNDAKLRKQCKDEINKKVKNGWFPSIKKGFFGRGSEDDDGIWRPGKKL